MQEKDTKEEGMGGSSALTVRAERGVVRADTIPNEMAKVLWKGYIAGVLELHVRHVIIIVLILPQVVP